MRRLSSPPSAASTAFAILSVSTSMISWPGVMVCPSSTCHAESVPSFIERPHFGMTSGVMFSLIVFSHHSMLLADRLAHPGGDRFHARNIEILERRRERHRRMRSRDHADRPLQGIEGLLCHDCRDVRGDRTARIGLVDADEPAGSLDTLDDRVHIDRRQGPEIDDLAIYALLGQ